MRGRVSRLLNNTAQHYRYVPVDDGAGGQVDTLTLMATMACRRRQPIVAVEGELGQGDVTNVTDVVYLHPGEDVQRNDELHIDGEIFDVHAVYPPSGSIYLRVDCRSRQR
jgi:hypothetical protein